MAYSKQTWTDGSTGGTPLSAARLQHMEDGIAAAASDASTVQDAVSEWWIQPQAVYDSARSRTIGGGLSSNRGDNLANVIAWERNHGTGRVQRYEIGTALVDDHNVPAVQQLPDGSVLALWNNHNEDHVLRAKLSNRAGDLASLVAAPELTWTIGFPISYGQVYVVDGDATSPTWTVWVFCRLYRGDGWAWEIIPLTIATATRAITRGTTMRFLSGGTNQAYASTGWDPATSRIRVAAGYNPSADRHEVYAFEIDPATGAVTSLADGALSANVLTQTSVPIDLAAATPLIPEVAAGSSRRLFYPRPGPAAWAVAFAEWGTATPDAATYKLRTLAPGVPDAESGLKASAGYASAPDSALFDDLVNGFQMTWVGAFDSAPSGDREVARRYLATGDRQWYLRVTSSGFLKTQITRAPDAGQNITSVNAVPNIYTAPLIGLRLKYERVGGTGEVTFHYSTDGTTWTQLDPTPVSTGTALLFDTTAPLIIGSPVDTLQHGIITYRHELLNSTGQVVSAVDWAAQTQDAATVADSQGNVFALSGDATVWSTTAADVWTTHDLAIAGPRVGFNVGANYIGGMGFRYPCQSDDPVLLCRRDAAAGKSYLEEHYLIGGAWVTEQVDESTSYLMRPSRPVGGGPLRAVYTEITAYAPDNYTDYEGNLHTA